ncbi:MAG: hypothetical protein GTN67_13355, partial [Hydrotalea flava]|nr:hypothetical protein [Hydrotalea flava]NIO95071.1 hypothetical protein [Hydrotalea flava]NIS93895.1 hypothetical protein [Hydrotalea flava]
YALAKQGVLSDMSIGFRISSKDVMRNDEGNFELYKIDVMEISPVGEPQNTDAKIEYVKSAINFYRKLG